MMVLHPNIPYNSSKKYEDYQQIFQNLQILLAENTENVSFSAYLKSFTNILFYDLDYSYAVYSHKIWEEINLNSAVQKFKGIKYIVFLKNVLPYPINFIPTAPNTIKPSKKCLLYLWKYYKKEYEWIEKHPEQLCSSKLSELFLMEAYIKQLNERTVLDRYMSKDFNKVFAWHYWPEQRVLNDLMLDILVD